MSKKVSRMRVFAGPNGSGKSTIIKEIQKIVKTGPYINADDIEKVCQERKFLNLGDYNLNSNQEIFNEFLTQSSSFVTKAKQEGVSINLSFSKNIIKLGKNTNSYEAALIASFLRSLFLKNKETFSFETVMSHPSKLDVFKQAHALGYQNYLYFISTDSVDINIKRIEERVQKGGHFVSENKIRERYMRSMDLISNMIPYCHRCFILDNSESNYRLILELDNSGKLKIHTSNIPLWVHNYILTKLIA